MDERFDGPLTEAQAQRFFRQLASGLVRTPDHSVNESVAALQRFRDTVCGMGSSRLPTACY